MHKDEQQVEEMLKGKDKKEKNRKYERIRNIGNHLHNVSATPGELSIRYRVRKDLETGK